MNTGPINTVIENEIAEAVEKFAAKNGLECSLWYHDLPLWIVNRKSPVDDLIQEMQVAVYAHRGVEELCFIPHAYVFEDGGTQTTSPEATVSGVAKIRLGGLVNMKRKELLRVLNAFLERVWKNAAKLTKNDLNLQLPL